MSIYDEGLLLVGGVILLFAIPSIIYVIWSNKKAQIALVMAEQDYFSSLDKLENEPGNTKLRVKALELGRKYYSLKNPSFHYVDLQTGEEGGGVNNRAGNEAQIQSDIQMRIGGQKESA